MHTEVIEVEGFLDVRVHHNSDWSGNATLQWTREGNHAHDEVVTQVVIPGSIIQGIIEGALHELVSGLAEMLNKHTSLVSPGSIPIPIEPLPSINAATVTLKAE